MGCCLSRNGRPDGPYTGTGASASARAINEQPQPGGPSGSQVGNDESMLSPDAGGRRRRRSRQPLSQHINRPLRWHEWTSQNRIWTLAGLQRERVAFFDTRVTGRQEVWQTLHAALEVLWMAQAAARQNQVSRRSEDGPSEQDPALALATAQSILDAADITLPTGDIRDGAYDALGNLYQFPHYIVSDPSNLSWRPGAEEEDLDDNKADLTAGEETEDREDGDDIEDEVGRRREEKGKAVVDVRDLISIKARLSDGSKDVNISVDKGSSARSVARQIAEETRLPSSKKIRLVYMGKMLKDSSRLVDQGYKQGHVINAFVFNR
ncbi:hypothetical protein QBC35DRAFT_125887 [Podospora australis]|uniref:Ubiquitin-like domain-containing protein n=1 Tax=Podospora australis TaxID=1536484 RepID=A0AAN6WJM4_9PEZI|nr:hypothetical protein QBC35DRAFT_125887 [Podospora australis]